MTFSPFNPNVQIPNNPFYSPESGYLYGPTGPLIIGSGLSINQITGTIDVSGGGSGAPTILPGVGISVVSGVGTVTIANTGILTLTAGSGISVSGSGSNLIITNTAPSPSTIGTVTSVSTGTGLVGGPITSTGTISLKPVGTVAPGTYTNATITVDIYGRVTFASPGSGLGSLLQATAPLSVNASIPQTISINNASIAAPGAVQLNSSTNSTSTTQAATPSAVKTAVDLATLATANAATALSSATAAVTTANNAQITANTAQVTADAAIPRSSFTSTGQVLAATGPSTFIALNSGTNGQVLAACSTCISGLTWVSQPVVPGTVTSISTGTGLIGGPITTTGTIDLANTAVSAGAYTYGSFTVDAQGRLTAASSGTAPLTALTGTAPIAVTAGITPVVSIAASSTTASGAVQLYNNTDSTSIALALTAAQGKNLQDQITALAITSNITLGGTYDANTGLVSSVTTQGTTAGLVVGSALPAPGVLNNEIFVIVDVQGTNGPNSPTLAHVGDWYLSDGTTWQFLNVGNQPTAATTTTAGIVCLSTDALAQAGTDATTALTPAAGASAYLAKSALTAKGDILGASGACTPLALAVGSDGQILAACASAATGLCWVPGIVNATPTVAGIVLGCTTANNSALGCNALRFNTTGSYNTANGVQALHNNATGKGNTAAGNGALYSNTTGNYNTANSINALYYNTTGNNNTANGVNALYSNTTGNYNTAIGYNSGFAITSGCLNIAIGCAAQVASPTGSCQLAIGFSSTDNWLTGASTKAIKPGAGIIDCANSCGTAGQVLVSTGSNAVCWGSPAAAATPTVAGIVFGCTTANYSALGCNALVSNTTGIQNTAIGVQALFSNTTGNYNTAIGYAAGCQISSGCLNIAIGRAAQVASPTGSCQLSIGFSATDNWLIGTSTKAIKPGAGVIDCANSCGTAGQVLMSNGSNAICWGAAGSPPATPTVAGIVLGCTTANYSALGCNALVSNTVGINNTANGVDALRYNTTGSINTANGACALFSNTTGNVNTAYGVQALFSNTTGCYNTANGASALCLNTTGNNNTANGTSALRSNTTGNSNTATGNAALFSNTTGCHNTANGANALLCNTTGINNVAIGYHSLCNSTGFGNTGIGSNGAAAPVFNVTTENNRVVMGTTAVTNAYIQVAWTVVSDARDKIVEGTVPHGLEFVSRLEPKAFRFKEKRESEVPNGPLRYGFLAQDILALEEGEGVIIDAETPDKLLYNGEALVPVLVNAVKELFEEVKLLKVELAALTNKD